MSLLEEVFPLIKSRNTLFTSIKVKVDDQAIDGDKHIRGRTCYPQDKKVLIMINTRGHKNYKHIANTFMHELAHLLCPFDDTHKRDFFEVLIALIAVLQMLKRKVHPFGVNVDVSAGLIATKFD